jgi:hypothetical protein
MRGAPCWCLALRLRDERGGEANRESAQHWRGEEGGRMIIPGNPPGKGGESRAE